MKKLLYIVSILLLGAVSCTREANDFVEKPTVEKKGMVAVTMGLRLPVELTAGTRADYRDHLPKIDAIRVAVFGTSSYPQAYELATPVNRTVDGEGNPVYTEGQYAYTNDDIYYFKVLLPVYEGEAIVHIVANGDTSIPFLDQTENSIMSKMTTTGNVGGYWARVILEDGILAQTNTDGIMQTDDDGNYIPSAETARLFKDLVLVRNFAEVQLTVDANAGISDVTWALVNDPVSGSLAPMVGTTFVDDFKDYVYDTKTAKMVLCDMVEDPDTGKMVPERDDDGNIANIHATYNGYMVSNSLNTLPAAESDLNWKTTSESQFTYERVDPNRTNPTFIMMKAKFGSDSDYTYYRVDLMDENVGGYFPLYRNYVYKIKIDLVGNRGASTFTEAANRNSGGNVSMSAETKTLTDVSDGFSRMYVEYVEKTFTTGGQKSFWVYYIPDVSTGEVDNRSIEVSVKEMGTALANATITLDPVRSVDTGEGAMYFYNYTLKNQSADEDLVSVIQVKATNGKTGTQKSTLYRDITVTVMKTMDMVLGLAPAKLPEGKDQTTVLHIALADTLQPSMFPLEFYIEDTNRTLNPTGKDGYGNSIAIPVKIGESIWDSTNQNSYYFIRTVNWDEYEPMRDAWVAAKEAGTSTDGIIDFTTQLKSIEEISSTTIYVDNEYFNMNSIDLVCSFFSVSTTTSTVGYQAGTASVTVSTDPSISWTATVDNGGGLTRAAGEMTITGTGTETFTVNYDANTAAEPKVYTVTVTSDDDHVATTTITQRRAPLDNATFNGRSFTSATSSSDSGDGYLTVTLNARDRSNNYITMRIDNSITFTPKNGVTITEIVITYTDQTTRVDTAPRFSTGDDPVRSGASVTWTGSSASAITYTCGSGNSGGTEKRISSIRVTYR